MRNFPDRTHASQGVIERLVSMGVIPEDVAKEVGAEIILERIERTFDSRKRREYINPGVKVGCLLECWRLELEMTQKQAALEISQQYLKSGFPTATGQSNFSRIATGTQSLTYINAMAFLRVVREKTGVSVPGEFLSPWDDDRRSTESLLSKTRLEEIESHLER